MHLGAAFLAAVLSICACAAAGRPNLALNKVCKATSVEGKLTPDKAVDGPKSQASRWGSDYATDKNKDSAWFYVDLGKPHLVDSVAIYWEHSGAKSYSIQAWDSPVDTPSHDDAGWKTLFSDTTLRYQPPPVDMCLSFVKLQPVQTRYVRIRCYKRLFEFGYSIMELEVYGNEGGTGLRPPTPKGNRNLRTRGLRGPGGFSLNGRWLPGRFLH